MKETWLKTEIGPIHIAEENGKIVACDFCQTVGERQESSPILEEAKNKCRNILPENENSSRFHFKPREQPFKKAYGKNCKNPLWDKYFI